MSNEIPREWLVLGSAHGTNQFCVLSGPNFRPDEKVLVREVRPPESEEGKEGAEPMGTVTASTLLEIRDCLLDVAKEDQGANVALRKLDWLVSQAPAGPRPSSSQPLALPDLTKEIEAVRSYIARSSNAYLAHSDEKKERVHEMAEWGLSRIEHYTRLASPSPESLGGK